MIQRRTKLALLLLVGTLATLAVVWWAFGSLLLKKPVEQPPALPEQIQPRIGDSSSVGVSVTTTALTPEQVNAETSERQQQALLKRLALQFGTRVGSYSSGDGFLALTDAAVGTAEEVQAFLTQERARLQKEHPIGAASWGQSTRAVAARFLSPLPINTQNRVELVVQSEVAVETGVPQRSRLVTYKETVIEYTKTDGMWRVSRVSWRPFEP